MKLSFNEVSSNQYYMVIKGLESFCVAMKSHEQFHEIIVKSWSDPQQNSNVSSFASQVLSLFDEALEPPISVAFEVVDAETEAEPAALLLPETWFMGLTSQQMRLPLLCRCSCLSAFMFASLCLCLSFSRFVSLCLPLSLSSLVMWLWMGAALACHNQNLTSIKILV